MDHPSREGHPEAVLVADPALFAIEIDFRRDSKDPARVFRAMTELIEASAVADAELAAPLRTRLRPALMLHEIETGSIRTWLKAVAESVDDETLRSGDYKKVIGSYLVKAKRRMVDYLQSRETIKSAAEIRDLQAVIREAAQHTEFPLQRDEVISTKRLADAIKRFSDATGPLDETDTANYLSIEGSAPINTSFRVSAEKIEEILTAESIVAVQTMILKVKRPDFLGDSMWDFRFEGRRLSVKLLDTAWVDRFRNREVTLHPGDALRGQVEVETKYDADGEVIATHHRILKVEEVLERS